MDVTFDVVALGELLVDLTQHGESDRGNLVFEGNPGGAPANVLAMLRKLGHSAAFIGKVGSDSFGDLLKMALEEFGIDDSGLRRDGFLPTTLAVVHNTPEGDRDFTFYRKPGADVNLSEEELELPLLRTCRIFHFGSLSLTDEPCRSATRRALKEARAAGALISFDPNYRAPLWADEDAAREQIRFGIGQCDLLKISDNELTLVTGERDFARGAAALRELNPALRLIHVTAGAEGSHAFYEGRHVSAPALKLGGVVDTSGAGDTFCACTLSYVLRHGLEALTDEQLLEMLTFANAAAYLVTTKKGALRSMPEPAAVEALLAR